MCLFGDDMFLCTVARRVQADPLLLHHAFKQEESGYAGLTLPARKYGKERGSGYARLLFVLLSAHANLIYLSECIYLSVFVHPFWGLAAMRLFCYYLTYTVSQDIMSIYLR